MFRDAKVFNNTVSATTPNNPTAWNVAKVKDMSYMFNNAAAFQTSTVVAGSNSKDNPDWGSSITANKVKTTEMFTGTKAPINNPSWYPP